MSKVPPIRKSLEYTVILAGKQVNKTPNIGFGFKVESDLNKLNKLKVLAPITKYDAKNNILIQQAIRGRFAKEKELKKIGRAIKKKGLIPRGLLPQDVIVTSRKKDKRLRFKVVDVGNFEVLR